MKRIIAANWKMLPATPGEARELLARMEEALASLEGVADRIDLIICPPFVFLEEVATMLAQGALRAPAVLGAQDVAVSDAGAQTGEVGAAQLAALGVRYVIVGHSERRWKLGESDDVVNVKLKTVLAHEMVPIVCLGERTREGNWQDALRAQTEATFAGIAPSSIARCVVAYEPVWAISTNPDAKPDTPASAVQAMSLIRETLADRFMVSQTTFLYGGSVTPVNVKDFLERSEISGVLVGGASVRPDDFVQILTAGVTIQS
jgi:triosephosphate isomerase